MQSCVKGEAMSEQLTGSTPVMVALPAEIDLSNAEQVYDRLYTALASGAAVVIADFTGTRFCDCACLNRLLRVHNQAAGHNAQLRLARRCGRLSNCSGSISSCPSTQTSMLHRQISDKADLLRLDNMPP
jgi:hypothetical protein